MGAGPQHLLGFGRIGIGKLLRREVGPHGSAPFDHSPEIKNLAGVEALFYPGSERRERRRLGLEDRDGAAQGRRTIDQGRVTGPLAVRPADRGADHRGTAILRPGNGGPDRPPPQSRYHLASRSRAIDWASSAPRLASPIHARRLSRRYLRAAPVADARQNRVELRLQLSWLRNRSEFGRQPFTPKIDRRRGALETKRDNPGHPRKRGQRRGRGRRDVGCAGNLMRKASAPGSGLPTAAAGSSPPNKTVQHASGCGTTFTVTSSSAASVP